MSTFCISTKNFNEFKSLVKLNSIVVYQVSESHENLTSKDNSILEFSSNPKSENTQFSMAQNIIDTIENGDNNFSTIFISQKENRLILSSSRFTRAQIYYTFVNEDFYFSNSFKELIPFSIKKLNRAAALSTVKFGDSPDYLTLVQGIYKIPNSHYLDYALDEILNTEINFNSFKQYFKIPYTFEGGNIDSTEQLLNHIGKEISLQNILVPLSGGIDSTLMNCIISQYKEDSYPAYFMQFGKKDPELTFAKMAAENTKAQLEVFTMKPHNFFEAFEYQYKHLESPVGESSPIAMAFLFAQNKFQNHTLVDGTLADGCYGSRSYKGSLFDGISKKSNLEKHIAENIGAYLQKRNIKGNKRFFPRDAMISDDYLHFMASYVGPLANKSFKNSPILNKEIEFLWQKYYNLIDYPQDADNEEINWLKYTIFKMIGYASKITTAKIEDLKGSNNVIYPFMWKSILEDQGKYTFQQKTEGGIIKHPLKKILSKFKGEDFVYRKKVGLNSSFDEWIENSDINAYMVEKFNTNNDLIIELIGKKNIQLISKSFRQKEHNPNLNNFVLSLSTLNEWAKVNDVTL